MIRSIKFGLKILMLNLGVNFSQLAIRYSDHNRPYKGKRMPLSVAISCTYHCNLNCLHCSAPINNKKEDPINTKRFIRLIDEIAAAGTIKIGFNGGEPLVRSDIGEILDRCYENKLITTLTSNGLLVPKYIDKLKKLSVLFLSLEGNREVNDYIRGKGTWDKFHEAVSIAKANKIPVVALTNLNAINYQVFTELPDIFKKLKINWMIGTFNEPSPLAQKDDLPPKEYYVSLTDTNKIIDYIKKSKNLKTSRKYLELMCGKNPMTRCYAGIGHCVIHPYGLVYPCFKAENKGYDGISILDKSFKDAFNEMLLYRETCNTCTANCYAEANYVFELNPNAIINAYKLSKPIN